MNDAQPVIVVKRKKVVAGHGHSSAWKIAFADFAVAMMAFFLVLWLTESTSLEEQQAISGYFTDPVGFKEGGQRYIIDLGGSGDQIIDQRPNSERATVEEAESVIDAETVKALAAQIERQQFEALAEEIRTVIRATETLKALEDQVELTVTKEGLQIQILDKESRPMFGRGSDKLAAHAEAILSAVGQAIGELPNRISIAGHTDALVFSGRRDYSNWELSSERANAARRILRANGVREEQVTRVVGKGSSTLYLPEDPLNPINRRISILVLSKQREEDLADRFSEMQAPGVSVAPFTRDPELNADATPAETADSPPAVPGDAASSLQGPPVRQQPPSGTPAQNLPDGAENAPASFGFDDGFGSAFDLGDDPGVGDSVSASETAAPSAADGQVPQPEGQPGFEFGAPETPPQVDAFEFGASLPAATDPAPTFDGADAAPGAAQTEPPDEPAANLPAQDLLPAPEDLPQVVTPEEKPWWEN